MPNAPKVKAREAARSTISPTAILYVESSALLRILLEKDQELADDMATFDEFLTSALTLVEVPRALNRAVREGRLDAVGMEQAHSSYVAFTSACAVAEITRQIRERAAREFPLEPVRSLDAIHLATISTWTELIGTMAVASCDDRVARNARALGCSVIPRL